MNDVIHLQSCVTVIFKKRLIFTYKFINDHFNKYSPGKCLSYLLVSYALYAESQRHFKKKHFKPYNMKKLLNTVIITLVIVFSFSGCVEHHYYQQNNRHRDNYNHRYHHRHSRTHTDIDLNIHN